MSRGCVAIVLAGILWTGTLLAADPVPQAPYLAKTPDFCSWTVRLDKPAKKNPAPASDGANTSATIPAPVLLRREVTKGRDIRRDVLFSSDGTKSERWFYHGMDFVQIRSGSILIMDPSSNEGAPNYGGYRDFPELEWVDARNFTKAEKAGGVLCFRYRYNGNERGSSVRTVHPGMEAWIDVETGRPVAFEDGGDRYVYEFSSSTPESLRLPAAFQAEYDAFLKPARDADRFKMQR